MGPQRPLGDGRAHVAASLVTGSDKRLLQLLVLLAGLPDAVDNAAQVMPEALVVIEFKAEEGGFAVARHRSERGVDVFPREVDSYVANRDRQPRCGRAPIDGFLCCSGVLLKGDIAIARQCYCRSLRASAAGR